MTDIATAPPVSKEIVSGKLNIALTRHSLGIQALNDLESSLVYNEDNLSSIKAFLDKAREAKKVIASEHKLLKEAPLRECQTIDESRRGMDEQIDASLLRAQSKYENLCRAIEKRKRDAETERLRKTTIRAGIDALMVTYSSRIASCTTLDELVQVEKHINLEKARKDKYEEFFDEAVARYRTLTALLSAQKEKVKELTELRLQTESAKNSGDDQTAIDLQEKETSLLSSIEEAKVTVQETAINQTLAPQTADTHTEVLPEIKVRRATWDWEISNLAQTQKLMPSWVKMEAVTEKIDEFLKASKDGWNKMGTEEITLNGIRFYLKRTY